MPLDISEIRAAFAHHLQQHAASRYSLDAALMHVVERAYQQGHHDALQVPDVLQHSPAILDHAAPHRVRGAHAAPHGPGQPTCLSGSPHGGKACRPAARGTAAHVSPGPRSEHLYGCHDTTRAGAGWQPIRCGHTLRASDPSCTGCINREE